MSHSKYRQHVPRPVSVVPGNASPWSDRVLGPEIFSMQHVRHVLKNASMDDGACATHALAVNAAVLVPVFEREGAAHLIFIRRSFSLARDPGHIAFPGGRIDGGETPRDAALREAHEEIGLMRSMVSGLTPLPIAKRSKDGQIVAPFVGFVTEAPAYVPSAAEVDGILEIPLAAFAAPNIGWEEHWMGDGRAHPVRFFAEPALLGTDLIWGLTAAILWQLLDCITAPS